MLRIVACSLFALVVSGCNVPPGESRTTCGPAVCEAGQYCVGVGLCQNGCLTRANCLPGQECVDVSTVTGDGVCEGGSSSEGEGEGEGEGDPAQACLDACDRFADCGMRGSDHNDCLNTCPDLSANQQRTVAQCANGSCGDSLNCLEMECFSDADCSVGTECVGDSCL